MNIRAERFKAFEMQVDRPRSNRAAAGQRDPRLAAAGQQRPHDEKRRPHLADQIIRRFTAANHRAVHVKLMPGGVKLSLDSQLLQYLGDRMHIFQRRHLVQQAGGILPEKRRRDDRQHRVLGSADLYPALQPASPMYNQLFH